MTRLEVTVPVDVIELQTKVMAMYRSVAEDPSGSFHFELGRGLAERLGYPPALLDTLPVGAVESFAGVGYFFDLAEIRPGDTVLDLGSGSGMDAFFAARRTGETGSVTGIDMTPEQLAKAEALRARTGFTQVTFRRGDIQELPFDDGAFDVVISNGVVNLVPDKRRVFLEAARVLRDGGRLAIADIVAASELPRGVVANSDLWASCIGGAAQQDAYQEAIADAGLSLEIVKRNPYEFISRQARDASAHYGVRSVSILARRRERPS